MASKGKEKSKTPAVAHSSTSIEDLFTSLNQRIKSAEYKQAVKVADQILSIAPGDEDAICCKIVALIKNDNIDDALKTIESSQRLPIDLNFYKAYCLYRQNKLDEALQLLKSQEKNTAAMLLESQILYRLGRIDASLEIYQELQKSKIDNLEINFVAGLVSAGRASEVKRVLDTLKVKATSSFELAYNTACSLIDRNEYRDAEQLLLSARRVGQETLMGEDMADDDMEVELAPIAIQLAYVQQLLGQTQEAVEAYSDIVKQNLADDSSLAVAINNLIALKGPKDVSDSLKKLDRLIEKNDHGRFQLARGLDQKLSAKHREAIYVNRVLLLLHANRMDQARELVIALQDMFPGSVMPVLIQAAVFVRENKAGRAEEILGQFAEKFPDKSKVLLLAKAQVAAAAGHLQVAAESLAMIPDIQHMPATVATIVALKDRAGDIDGAVAVFDSAIQWWSNAMTDDSKLSVIMQEAASFKLKHGREKEAFLLFEELVRNHGSVDALVGLVTTAAHVDVGKAEAYEKQLSPLPGLNAIDVESLEKTSGAKPAGNGSHLRTFEMNEEIKNKEKTKKKRKRKPRYPKGFDPANPGPPPDPERWLPKRERSSYRPKRKDKRAAHVRGSQGTVVREKHDAGAADNSSRSGVDHADANAANSKSNQAGSSKGATHNAAPSKSSKKKSRKR
ncbi:hypothetical protein Nepgr_004489 [Nepenthes gracilis]|uniref:Signal recognition particle subunit SRP72 n=1 Tax=Nepenthes gracilis TaxID=150966 RepID=A0AAD3S1G8_NEPGR|nr:hypothetical protein Nepgr_004489 [Nepenthes gracilis]